MNATLRISIQNKCCVHYVLGLLVNLWLKLEDKNRPCSPNISSHTFPRYKFLSLARIPHLVRINAERARPHCLPSPVQCLLRESVSTLWALGLYRDRTAGVDAEHRPLEAFSHFPWCLQMAGSHPKPAVCAGGVVAAAHYQGRQWGVTVNSSKTTSSRTLAVRRAAEGDGFALGLRPAGGRRLHGHDRTWGASIYRRHV